MSLLENAYSIPKEVRLQQLEDQAVILNLKSGIYFGLNPIGVEVWRAIESGAPLPALCLRLTDEYDVEEATLKSDVEALLQDLLANGLIAQ
ncbi:MAG: PqqD family protein [Pseudomonadota bacterium]